MAVLLANVLLTVWRPRYNATLNATEKPTPNLAGVLAHIAPIKASAYVTLPETAVKSQYEARVDTFSDVATGDQITAITLLDGITPWPGDFNANLSTQPGQDPTSLWYVTFHQESAPGMLAYRALYLSRWTGNGPMHQ